MSTILNLDDARARVTGLSGDDAVLQDILDETEDWLAARIGPLTGERDETFFVGGYGAGLAGSYFSGGRATAGKLGLARYTDAVDLTDNAVAVDADHFRLIDLGSAVIRSASSPTYYWTGPYVVATYTPNDELRVRAALYDLLELDSAPDNGMAAETLGDYSYQKVAAGAQTVASRKAAIVSSLLPKRDSLVNLVVSRRHVAASDPVINRAEPWT